MDISKLNAYSTCQWQVEEFLNQFEVTGIYSWTLPKVMTAIMAASLNRNTSDRYNLIAAKAIEELTPEEQHLVRSQVNLSPGILQADTALTWPAAVVIEEQPTNLDEIRERARRTVAQEIDKVGLLITGTFYPDVERQSWAQKHNTAVKYLAEPISLSQTELTMLSAEANQTGETLELISQKILARAEAFMIAVGTLTGIRRVAQDAILEADDAAEVKSAIDTAKMSIDDLLAYINS